MSDSCRRSRSQRRTPSSRTRSASWHRALVDALLRRFAAHLAVFDVVAPSTSPGDATKMTPKTSIADKTAVIRRVGGSGREGRRMARDKTDLSLA